ncbi:hypothetical protein IJ531_02565, partial [bacterium]|nr:hypothetical protein [bacterium]
DSVSFGQNFSYYVDKKWKKVNLDPKHITTDKNGIVLYKNTPYTGKREENRGDRTFVTTYEKGVRTKFAEYDKSDIFPYRTAQYSAKTGEWETITVSETIGDKTVVYEKTKNQKGEIDLHCIQYKERNGRTDIYKEMNISPSFNKLRHAHVIVSAPEFLSLFCFYPLDNNSYDDCHMDLREKAVLKDMLIEFQEISERKKFKTDFGNYEALNNEINRFIDYLSQ